MNNLSLYIYIYTYIYIYIYIVGRVDASSQEVVVPAASRPRSRQVGARVFASLLSFCGSARSGPP